eukprot:m.447535 g.447535  ORF g.447535 m.447535 type:complete len:71 (+) comp19527_c0_seq1:24-236(+)
MVDVLIRSVEKGLYSYLCDKRCLCAGAAVESRQEDNQITATSAAHETWAVSVLASVPSPLIRNTSTQFAS